MILIENKFRAALTRFIVRLTNNNVNKQTSKEKVNESKR